MWRKLRHMVQFIFEKDSKMDMVATDKWVLIKDKMINLSMCESISVNETNVIFNGAQNQRIGIIVCKTKEEAREIHKTVGKIIHPTPLIIKEKKGKKNEQKKSTEKHASTTK